MCTDCKIPRDLLLGYFFSKRATKPTKPTAHSPYPAKIPGGYYRAAGRYHQHASCTLHAASSATLQSKCPLPTGHTSRVRMPRVIAGPWPSAERTDHVARHNPTARCRHPHTRSVHSVHQPHPHLCGKLPAASSWRESESSTARKKKKSLQAGQSREKQVAA